MGFERKPAIPLYEYQRAWVNDKARFKIGMWSRQCGKSFATSLESVLDCFERRTKWVFLSAGERQSKELMATAQMHARAINVAVEYLESVFHAEDKTEYKQLEINFPNGSRIVGLPANPNTSRGHSANILLDEFAFHQDSRAIWRALFPTVTRGWRIRIISTPQGKQNKFYELWSGNPSYSKYKITIFDAVNQGLELKDENGMPSNPDALREALGDEDAWAQEYLCEFVDEATAFLTYELIAEAEEQSLTHDDPPAGKDLYAGVDIGRKRDLTVFWAFENVGGILISRKIIEISKAAFSTQREIIFNAIKALNPHRVCFDATGLGMQLAEEAVQTFGAYRIEAVTFNNRVKEDMATTARRRFEDHQFRIPVDKKIREDLHSVKRIVTSAGNIRFDAERSEDGHADRFWALALAAHAATAPSARAEYQTVQPGRMAAMKGAY